jgi:hypothetical protein
VASRHAHFSASVVMGLIRSISDDASGWLEANWVRRSNAASFEASCERVGPSSVLTGRPASTTVACGPRA